MSHSESFVNSSESDTKSKSESDTKSKSESEYNSNSVFMNLDTCIFFILYLHSSK